MSKSINPDFTTDEEWQPIDKPSTLGETVSAQFKLGLQGTSMFAIGNMVQSAWAAENNDIISPEEANQKFPTDVPFNEPVSAKEAESIFEHQQEKKRLQEIIAKGPQDIGSQALGFTAAIAGGALDPVGMLLGGGLSGVGKSAVNATIGKSLVKSATAKRIAGASLEGALGNAVAEAAFVIPAQIAEKEDIEAGHQILTAAAGGALIPVGFEAVKGIYKGLRNLSPKQAEKLVDVTEARINSDKNPNITEQELELITKERGDTLKNEYQELLDQRTTIEEQLKSPDVDNTEVRKQMFEIEEQITNKANEMDAYASEFNSADKIREDLNAPRNDLYYNPEAAEIIENLEVQADDTPINQIFDEQYGRLDDLEPEVREAVESVNQEFAATEGNFDEFIKATHFCVTGS